MSLVVLDTDVASTVLRRRASDALSAALAGHVLAITFVTVGELTKWTLVRRWGPRGLETMRTFLAGLVVLPYDQRVAARWGELQAYAQLRGRPRPVNDSWIAACCLVRGVPLATLNIKDFADFAEHEGLELIPLVGGAGQVPRSVERPSISRYAPAAPNTATISHRPWRRRKASVRARRSVHAAGCVTETASAVIATLNQIAL